MAILAIGKLGSRQHVLLLEPLLTDDTLCEASPEDEKARYRCEVRDVALAVIIHLHAQKPKDFGFERIQGNSQSLFNYNSMGFASTEQRQKALAKWKQWLASNAAKADANLKR
jgi:hypothetical protein